MIVIAVEEKPHKLQISETAQKIFQIDGHVGVAAAGYIPDARSQVDNARFFSQSNKLTYDEPVEVETVAKHLAEKFPYSKLASAIDGKGGFEVHG